VVGTLSFPRLTYTEGFYSPTWVEVGILIGSVGLFGFLYFAFIQLAPIVSLWEVREGEHIRNRPRAPEHPPALHPAPQLAAPQLAATQLAKEEA